MGEFTFAGLLAFLGYEEPKKKEAEFPEHASIPHSESPISGWCWLHKHFKDLNIADKLSQVKSTNG